MLKRYATLMLGIGLVGLGVLFFAKPDWAYLLTRFAYFWPLFLILAGIVRVTGHLIDRHPRSPVGGLMLIAMGGIVLAVNLRGGQSFIYILAHYWFWLLLALIVGSVMRQYTHRPEDGPRPRAFGFGTIFLSILIIGGGLAAHFLAADSSSPWRLESAIERTWHSGP